MPPSALKNRAGDTTKSMKNRTFDFRGCPGALGVPPWLQKWSIFDFLAYLRSAYGKICDGPVFDLCAKLDPDLHGTRATF